MTKPNSRLRWELLQCGAHTVTFYKPRHVNELDAAKLTVEDGNYPDMTGCIAFVQGVAPGVGFIAVADNSGRLYNQYKLGDTGWVSVNTPQRTGDEPV